MPVDPFDPHQAVLPDDAVMLSILANGGTRGMPLAPEEARLLGAWSDGQLTGEAAARASALVRRNALAAEFVLERRLLLAAARGPAAPPLAALPVTAERQADRPRPSSPDRRRRIFPRWRWPMTVGGVVLASLLALAAVPLVREAARRPVPLQLALVSLPDRAALFEPSDIRLRGGERAPVPATDRRFRDLELPVDVARGLFVTDGSRPAALARDIEALLPPAPGGMPIRVLVDDTLRAQADVGSAGSRVKVRLYDLGDPRAADLRQALGVTADPDTRSYLLAPRP